VLIKDRILDLDSLSNDDRELLDLTLTGRPVDPVGDTSPPPEPIKTRIGKKTRI